ncbi:hypothetical protein ACSBR1_006159 [Camellia fascicularis]
MSLPAKMGMQGGIGDVGQWSLCFRENLTNLLNFSGELYLTSQKTAFKCLMMHLKIVKFDGSRWNYCDFHFSFAQFLLKNARVLQKMVINMLDCILQKEHFQAAQRFLSFPRSSPDAVIMFN